MLHELWMLHIILQTWLGFFGLLSVSFMCLVLNEPVESPDIMLFHEIA